MFILGHRKDKQQSKLERLQEIKRRHLVTTIITRSVEAAEQHIGATE